MLTFADVGAAASRIIVIDDADRTTRGRRTPPR